MEIISVAIIPLMIFAIIAHATAKRVKVFDAFINGAKDGIDTCFRILPSLIGLLTAISMFRASGALTIITNFIAPVLSMIQFPKELVPLAFMRPISGSGALAIVRELLSKHGPDSFLGRATSVMMGSTETTFYTIAIYFGSINVKDIRYTVKAALLADLTGILVSVYVVRLLLC
ncbi:MAG: spore maturation protein [Firmicutes bacterium]|nr:spore maturation protein [Bacillota bacterium]